jgi:hypothetical protein
MCNVTALRRDGARGSVGVGFEENVQCAVVFSSFSKEERDELEEGKWGVWLVELPPLS